MLVCKEIILIFYLVSEHSTIKTKCNALHHKGHNAHLLQYCCHNAGVNHRDFKFSVLNLKKTYKLLNNSVTLARYRHTP